jgi:hypothetical protein
MSRETLLIPIVFPDPGVHPIHESFVKELSGFDISLLGYWEVDEDESVEEVREENKTEAEAVLYDLAARFSEQGSSADIQLYFGPPGQEESNLRDRVVEQTHASAVLFPSRSTLLRTVLVAVKDEEQKDKLVSLVTSLDPDTTLRIELYHAVVDEDRSEEAEDMLADMREKLIEKGFPQVELETKTEVITDESLGIRRRATSGHYDLVVMGETDDPDTEDKVFGQKYEIVSEETELPIMLSLSDR